MFPASFRDPDRFKETALECAPMHLGQVIAGSPVLLIVMYDGRKRAPDSEGDVLGLVSLGCVMGEHVIDRLLPWDKCQGS